MLKLATAIAAVMISAAPVLADNGPCQLIDKGGYKTWNNGACGHRRADNEGSYVMGDDGQMHNDKSIDSKSKQD